MMAIAACSSSPPRTSRIGGITSPSWSSSRATGIEPGAIPPMSAWWARVATKPIGCDWPANTGATVVMSGRCVPPRNGSFSVSTSPGENGARSITARTAAGIAPRCTGMCAACATICPLASKTAHE